MESLATQFVFALPMVLLSAVVGVRALLRPRQAGTLSLCFAIFGPQFCLGPMLGYLDLGPPIYASSGDVTLAFLGVYAFWAAVGLAALLWKSPLPMLDIQAERGVERARGLFANLAHAALRISLTKLVVGYGLILGARLFMLLRYDVVLAGTIEEREWFAIPYPIIVMYRVFENLGFAFVFVAVAKAAARTNVFERPVLLVIVGLEFLFALTQGRRYMLLLLGLAVFAVLVLRGGLRAKHAVAGLIGFVLLWQFFFPFFFFIREQWTYQPGMPVLTQIQRASAQALAQVGTFEARIYRSNVLERLNALSFNFQVAQALNGGGQHLAGDELRNVLIGITPRALYPQKLLVYKESDHFVNARLGLTDVDWPSNLPAFGLAEFGVLGCALYGALFAVIVRLVELMLRRLLGKTPLLAVAAVGSLASTSVFTMEFSPERFLETVRVIVLLWAFGLIVSLLAAPRPLPIPPAAAGANRPG